MKDDYLWDGTGKPDPEVERLELLLRRFRHDRPAPNFPELAPEPEQRPGLHGWLRPWWRIPRLAGAVATLALVVWGGWFAIRWTRPSWNVARVEGAPQVGAKAIGENGRLALGQSLQTDANSRARIDVGAIGIVEVDPNSRVRLLEARPTEHRLALDLGTIRATIWAPPRLFSVNTPSGVAVDLGCRYTLHVDPNGDGLLQVTYGWVAFEQAGHESFVPAEALAITRKSVGPGTPYYEDASESFRASLELFDFGAAGSPDAAQARAAALQTILAEARKRDSLTLWHLLSRTEPAERARVYDRLAQFIPPPAGVTRDGILGNDVDARHKMRDLWWDALGLGDTSWWRMWKGPVPVR